MNYSDNTPRSEDDTPPTGFGGYPLFDTSGLPPYGAVPPTNPAPPYGTVPPYGAVPPQPGTPPPPQGASAPWPPGTTPPPNYPGSYYPGQPPYGYWGQSPYAQAATPGTNTLAVVSLILAVGSFLTWGLAIIPAIICGHISLKQIKETGERGGVYAKAALGIAYVSLIFAVLFAVLLSIGVINGVPTGNYALSLVTPLALMPTMTDAFPQGVLLGMM